MLQVDEGYEYGLGVFTTMAVENGRAIFLEQHLNRLQKSLDFLQIDQEISAEWVETYIKRNTFTRGALKIMLSEKNRLITTRKNPYTAAAYREGFRLNICETRRNESAPLTYHKSLNYADNILEKRKSLAEGYDEPIFLNTRGEVCEGATTNIFFVKEDVLYTPQKSSGLLPGIMRDDLLGNQNVRECVILPDDLAGVEECFVTNALLGIMPVESLENHCFTKRDTAQKLLTAYREAWGLRPISCR